MSRHRRGLLDTSVVVDLEDVAPDELPVEVAISVVTLAELTVGPAATTDPAERARRQERVQLVEAAFDPLPFTVEAARAYGRIYASVLAHTGRTRKPRGARAFDLLIAATALAEGLPLYTRNPGDVRHLDGLLDVVPVTPGRPDGVSRSTRIST